MSAGAGPHRCTTAAKSQSRRRMHGSRPQCWSVYVPTLAQCCTTVVHASPSKAVQSVPSRAVLGTIGSQAGHGLPSEGTPGVLRLGHLLYAVAAKICNSSRQRKSCWGNVLGETPSPQVMNPKANDRLQFAPCSVGSSPHNSMLTQRLCLQEAIKGEPSNNDGMRPCLVAQHAHVDTINNLPSLVYTHSCRWCCRTAWLTVSHSQYR